MLRIIKGGWLAALLTARLAGAAPLPPDSAATPLPRLTLGFTSATRTTYFQRAPAKADDNGYFGTTLTYQAPKGFISSLYLNHSYAYHNLTEPFINYGELMGGWQSTSNSDTYWTVQYTHLFAYNDGALVQASLSNDFSASLTQFFSVATASISADYFVGSKKNDFLLTLDVSHKFQLLVFAQDTLSFEPTVELGAGSQHFYATSVATTSRVKTKKNGTTTTVLVEPDTPAFSVLGYTLSAPVTLDAGRYSVAITPSFLVPLHVPTGGSEQAFFYFTVGLSRTFW